MEYEWKPLKRNHCKMFGHIEEECRKKAKIRKEWREVQNHYAVSRDEGSTQPQEAARQNDIQNLRPNTEGYITTRRPASRRSPNPEKASDRMRIQNSFDPLQDPQGSTSNSRLKGASAPHG